MKSTSSLSMFVVAAAVILAGCSTKPPRDVDAAVRQRLTRYSEAWRQGDEKGVRDSFVARDADEAALLDAMAQLAPAHAKLRTAYYEQLGPIGRKIFGENDVSKISPGIGWDMNAQAAAHPYVLTYKKPDVLVQLKESDKHLIVPARNVGGGNWKLELGGFVGGRDLPEVTRETQRDVRRTNELTAAVRTGDPKEVQRVMLQHIGERAGQMSGPQREAMRDILGDGTTTRPTTQRSAKENPP